MCTIMLHSYALLHSSRTGSLPDRQSPGRFPTGPGITGLQVSRPAVQFTLTGGSPPDRGFPDYKSPAPQGGLCSPGLFRSTSITLAGLQPALRYYLTSQSAGRPGNPEPPSKSLNSQEHTNGTIRAFTVSAVLMIWAFAVSAVLNPSGLSPYRCYICI